jgi:hypothetical protein
MSDTPKEFSKEWFDDASKEWRANKRKLKGGAYRYTCETYTNGKKCWRDVCMKSEFCREHYTKQQSQNVVIVKNEIYISR